MSESTLRADGSLGTQPKMGGRNLHHFVGWPWRVRLPKLINRQAASLDA